jgi:hypothetical protein
MESKSDKKTVLWIIAASLAAILIFHFSWAPYLFMNWSSNLLFTGVDALLFGAFGVTSAIAYKQADDPNYDYLRKLLIWVAVASSIWAAAWSTGLMNNIEQGING